MSLPSLICEIFKNDSSELIYKTKMNSPSKLLGSTLVAAKGGGKGKTRSWGLTDTHCFSR